MGGGEEGEFFCQECTQLRRSFLWPSVARDEQTTTKILKARARTRGQTVQIRVSGQVWSSIPCYYKIISVAEKKEISILITVVGGVWEFFCFSASAVTSYCHLSARHLSQC